MNGNNSILVETEALKVEAALVESNINNLKTALDEFRRIVNAVNTYWEGDGADAHTSTYLQRADRIDEVHARFTEHVRDLREMAGIYEYAETTNQSEAESLPSDVIV